MAAILVLLAIILTAEPKANPSVFERPLFLMLMLSLVIVYMYFSAYLVQPDLMHGPAYAPVDAYRDYANALRIETLSGIDPNKMILETYYRAFPVVPVEIALMALITGLPSNIAHLIIGMAFLLLALSSMILISRFIFGERSLGAKFSAATFLPPLLILLQPIALDPTLVGGLTPLSFGAVSFLSLILYLLLKNVTNDTGQTGSLFVSMLLVMLVLVPLHLSAAVMAILLFCAVGLFLWREKSVVRSLGIISFVSIALYIGFYSGDLGSLFGNLNLEFLALTRIVNAGTSVISQLGASSTKVTEDEVNKILGSVPEAFVLAIASVMIVRVRQFASRQVETGSFSRRRLRSFALFCGVVFVFGFAGSFVANVGFGGLVVRYIVVALTPLLLLVTSVTMALILKNANLARRLLLLGLLGFYIVSVTTSPAFLPESSSISMRLIPTQSERASASFFAAKFEPDNTRLTLIIADFPFILHVQGVLLSEHFYENYVQFENPQLPITQTSPGTNTIFFSRNYFIQNSYIFKTFSLNAAILANTTKWNGFNKIFDDSSTSIYYTETP